jgi:DNA transposition AAA+ family ATPase
MDIAVNTNDPTLPEYEATRAELLALIDHGNGISRNEIATEADVSFTTVSQFISRKYTGSYANVNTKLRAWLTSRNERKALASTLPSVPDFFQTPTAAKVTAALTYAHVAADLVLIVGGAGQGKTSAEKAYAADRPNVWHVEMFRADSRNVACLKRVARTVGAKISSPAPEEIIGAIVEKVRNTNGLLIVDEAQHLANDALESLRGIHDQAGIGLVLSGNEELQTRMTGGSRAANFAQLFSRIGKRVRLVKPTHGDVEALADAWNVPAGPAREVLHQIAAKPGALRSCTKVLRMAAFMGGDKAVSADLIRRAYNDLGAEV